MRSEGEVICFILCSSCSFPRFFLTKFIFMPSGYSSTPLAKKLGIKVGFHILLFQVPGHYHNLFMDWPEGVVEGEVEKENSADFIHLFFTESKELKTHFSAYKKALKKTGSLWVSWPKGRSEIATDLKRDMIREYVLKQGLVDIKVAAIDEDWSGLKFVYRKKDR